MKNFAAFFLALIFINAQVYAQTKSKKLRKNPVQKSKVKRRTASLK